MGSLSHSIRCDIKHLTSSSYKRRGVYRDILFNFKLIYENLIIDII